MNSRQSLDYQYWLYQQRITASDIDRMKKEIESFKLKPKISLIMPVYNVEESFLRDAIESAIKQVYSNWELCLADDCSTKKHVKRIIQEYESSDKRIKVKFLDKNRGIAGASNEALTLATGDYIGFLDNDDELYVNTLFEIVKLLNEDHSLDIIYTDEDKIDESGHRVEPHFKPDWSPDLLLSTGYITHFVVYRRKLIEELNGLSHDLSGSQDYDLLLRATEKTNKIGHIPKPLYGWRMIAGSTAVDGSSKMYAHGAALRSLKQAMVRRSIKADVSMDPVLLGVFRVRYHLKKQYLVSIIIITHDRTDLLEKCLASIETKSTYKHYEIIIIDRKSEKKEALDYLKSLKQHTVIRYEGDLNIAKVINFAVKHTKGEHLIFLNDDIEVIDPDWIESMLEYSQRDDVGVVGNLLIYPPNRESNMRETIQHAGLVLGYQGTAGHIFYKKKVAEDNYFNLHRMVRNLSAVSGACMMVKRKVFDEVGGWDENLPIVCNDTDFCLSVRKLGYLVVYTPFAKMYHYEGATRGNLVPSSDEEYFINKWKDVLIRRDPYYNPNFSLFDEDYTISIFPSSNNALAALFEVYYKRPDLQRAFTEAAHGELQRLIEWAARHGVHEHGVLRPYVAWYTAEAAKQEKGKHPLLIT